MKILAHISKLYTWLRRVSRILGRFLLSRVFYAFPVQLVIHNLKKNQLLVTLWLILLGIVSENFGTSIGLPFLFLDPEYMNRVNFWSFFLIGLSLGIFTMSYHIICYILDAPHFRFAGVLAKPFYRFLLNNSFFPLLFLGVYLYYALQFQASYDEANWWHISLRIFGLILGTALTSTLIFIYFISTNQDAFKLLAERVDKRLKRSKVMRVNVMQRIQKSRTQKRRVDYYFSHPFVLKSVPDEHNFNTQVILKVFDQNHLNGVIIQSSIFSLILLIGTLRDYPYFQLPAAASLILLFTILLMFAGAMSYWLRGWATSTSILLILLLNLLMKSEVLTAKYEAYGLDYTGEKAVYDLQRVKELSGDKHYQQDRTETLIALENWRNKLQTSPNEKPKMVFICTSGGGQRAAMWAMRVLQVADSTLEGKLMDHTALITGASGGLVGAAYFRELCLQRAFYRQGLRQSYIDPYDPKHLENLGKDNLNAIVFSLVVNDLFFGFQRFEYGGYRYSKDRGFAFEQQLNRNTEGLLDKPLCDYREPELLSMVPMMILAPTIVNDGRKLFISPLNVSYMTVPRLDQNRFLNQKTKGIEFLRFFEAQNSANLRFLTALRMSATFPYVTPNVGLPSEPEMEIMDAGLSDNFGVSDAVRFLYAFRKWVEENTSGIIFVSIRDTQKDKPIEKSLEQSLFQRVFTPVTSLYSNLEYLQDIANDNMIEFAQSWFEPGFPIHRIEFQYVPLSSSLQEIEAKKAAREKGEDNKNPYQVIKIQKAALSWRLTEKEKASIRRTIYELRNQYSLFQLEKLLDD